LQGLSEDDQDAGLFTGSKGAPLQYSNWRRRVWDPACAALGLSRFVFHDSRRNAATALVLGWVDVNTAQARLDHSSSTVTLELYAQVTSDADRAAGRGRRRPRARGSSPYEAARVRGVDQT